MLSRINVLQRIIDKRGCKSYLEIGVSKGTVFFSIRVIKKIGVDPKFAFDVDLKDGEVKHFSDGSLYRMTSDDFFNNYAEKDLTNGIDLIFVDGFHTYSQSLRDVENGLKHLNEDGIIVLHDCNPLSAATAFPARESFDEIITLAKRGEIPGWNNCWNGDVWKTIAHLRCLRPDLDVFTLDLDWGLGIVTKRPRNEGGIVIPGNNIDVLEYEFLESNRNSLLNLKQPKYLDEFLDEYFQ